MQFYLYKTNWGGEGETYPSEVKRTMVGATGEVPIEENHRVLPNQKKLEGVG